MTETDRFYDFPLSGPQPPVGVVAGLRGGSARPPNYVRWMGKYSYIVYLVLILTY
jgi:hypothetical protein